MICGIDTATRLSAEKCKELKAEGIEFVGRYLVAPRGTLKWKALTLDEAVNISDAGMKILCVYETTADRARDGMSAGAIDGANALKCARDIKMPCNGIIYFAVDFGATSLDMRAIEEYLKAARFQTAEYDIGVYGCYDVVEYISQRNICKAYWQCVGWSGGKKSAALNVYQSHWSHPLCGISVDDNECMDMEKAGIWDYKEDNMTGEQIYEKLNEYLADLSAPDWAEKEFQEAIDMGITDGTRPMQFIPRYQAAIMAKRAVEKAISQ